MTQYRAIADAYANHKEETPISKYVELPSFWHVLGDVNGLDVLDLATGGGTIARGLQQRGARSVTGLDIEARLISNAVQQSEGILYFVADADKIPLIKEFDTITASFLMNYSRTKESLERKARNIYNSLKPGGHFVTLNAHPDNPQEPNERYGLSVEGNDEMVEGGLLTATLHHEGRPIGSFKIVHWSRKTYEEAFKKAGFSNLSWKEPTVTEEGLATFEPGFWNSYIAIPSAIILKCVK